MKGVKFKDNDPRDKDDYAYFGVSDLGNVFIELSYKYDDGGRRLKTNTSRQYLTEDDVKRLKQWLDKISE
jgi:hypothetical protein